MAGRCRRERSRRRQGLITAVVAVALIAGVVVLLPAATGSSKVAASDGSEATRAAYAAEVLADDPLSWWSLEEKSGTVAADATGPNQGFVQGGVSLGVPGPFGGDLTAMRFDGGRCTGIDVGRVPGSMALQAGFSIEQWVRTTRAANGIIFRWRNFGYGFYAGGSGLTIDGYPASGSRSASGGPGVADGGWHHVVASWTGAGWQVFRDGVKVGESTAAGPLRYSGENRVAIARDAGACDGFVPSFQGDIGHVAFYPKNLSADRVLAHYCAGGGTNPGCSQPVVARAGADQNVDEGSTVVLDGSASTDRRGKRDGEGGNLRFTWQAVTSSGSPAVLSSSSSPTPSFQALDDGTYTFGLTVADGDLTETDDVTVTVANRAPAVTTATVAPTDDGLAALTVGFTDQGVLDTHKATIDWGDGSPTDTSPVPADGTGWGSMTAAHVYGSAGNHTVQVTITDDDRGEGRASSSLTIAKPGPPPSPAIPAIWADAAGGSGVTVTGSGTEVTGLTHSNSALTVKGDTFRFTGGTEYVTTLTNRAHSATFSPPPVRVAASASPLRLALDDYAPGGRAALAAGADFHDETSRCQAGTWRPPADLTRGLYWIPCDVMIDGGQHLEGALTIAALGRIQVAGNGHRITAPFVDGVALVSGATGADAIRLNGARSLFGGRVAALAGEVMIAGNGIEVACTVLGTSVRISGGSTLVDTTRCPVTASGLADAVPVAAPPTVAPSLTVTPSVDPSTVTPGGTVGFALSAANSGATLVVPGLLIVVNGTASTQAVAGATASIEVFDESSQSWAPLATTGPPATASLIGVPSGAAGVIYGTDPNGITGTQLQPGSAAAWGLNVIAALDAGQLARVLDPTRTSGLRAKVSADLGPPTARLYQTVRFDPRLFEQTTSAGGTLTDVTGELTMPDGQRAAFPLADLAPGSTANSSRLPAGAPVPAAKASGEADDAYLARLAARNASQLVAGASARASSSVGPILAVQQRAAAVEQVPVVGITISGPGTVDSGTTAAWAVTLTNTGSAPASDVDLSAGLDGGGPLTITGAPAVLAPGARATATASYLVPGGTSTTLAPAASVTWSSPGVTYGPVGARTTTAARPPVALQVTKAWSSGATDPAGVFRYQVDIRNSGATPFTNVALSDSLDPNLEVVAGSVTVTGNMTVTSGNQTGDRIVAGTIGTLDPGAFALLEVRVDANRATAGTTTVSNQAVVTSDQLPPVPSDDPTRPGATDPTVTALADIGVPGGGGPGGGGPGGPVPTISGLAPAEGTTVTAPVEVSVGGVSAPEGTTVTGWQLSAHRQGDDPTAAIVLGSGSSLPGPSIAARSVQATAAPSAAAVAATVLASFDPTVVANGLWTLRLTVTDSGGGTGVAEAVVVVDGQLKLGDFETTYLDLSVPVGGIPMQLRRTYRTLDRRQAEDLGYGWSVDVASFKVQINRPLGQGGWTQRGCGTGLIFVPLCYTTDRPHFVTVTWPTGRTETFDFTPGGLNTFFPIGAIPAYTARRGATSRLEPAGADTSAGWRGDGNLYAGGFGEGEVYDPQQFVLVGKDGTRYLLDRTLGLVSATDRNGNTVTVDAAGIHSSQGPDILFTRGPGGRIDRIDGPGGQFVTYGYEPDGDLSTVTDANGRAHAYGYVADHLLASVDEPGAGPARSLTYVDGRLAEVSDGVNPPTKVSVDVPQRQEEVISPDLRETVVTTFDDRGNPVLVDRFFDGLSHPTRLEYNEFDLATYRRDPEGNEWRASYDPAGNLRSVTDAETNRTAFDDYTDLGLPRLITDPDSKQIKLEYHPVTGALSAIVDQLGNRQEFGHDDAGNLQRRWDGTLRPDGQRREWTWTYTPEGRVDKATDPAGAATDHDYDGAGRVTSILDPTNVRTEYRYDPVGNLRFVVAPLGRQTELVYDERDRLADRFDGERRNTHYEYDDAGQLESITNGAGERTTFAYTPRGLVETETNQAGDVVRYGYDGGGQLAAVTDGEVRVTRLGYDLAGRVNRFERPNGNADTFELDGNGRVTGRLDAGDGLTTWGYDRSGRLRFVTDPEDKPIELRYDDAGRLRSVVDPLLQQTEAGYDQAGRLTTLSRAGLESMTYGYDDAGRLSSAVDGEGRSQSLGYDDAGRPDAVTDGRGRTARATYDAGGWLDTITSAEGVTTDIAFDRGGLIDTVTNELLQTVNSDHDRAGRLSARTDAKGHTTRWGYDDAGRLDEVIDHLGGTVKLGHDRAGQVTSITDAAERTTDLDYDDLGNLDTLTDPLDRSWAWTYDDLGRLKTRTDPRSQQVELQWDKASRLRRADTPDGPITYEWDDAGRPDLMTDATGVTDWTFDAADRLTSVTSPAGTVGFGYDAGGRRDRLTLPQGDVTSTYDNAGGLDRVTDWTGGWADNEVDGDGMVRSTARSNGVTTTSEPDAVGRVGEIRHQGPAGLTDSYRYGYDPAGNRESVTSAAGAETYGFDDLDRITSARYPDGTSTAWTYHPDGSRKTETTAAGTTNYGYDAAGQLDQTTGPAGVVDYDHDPAGNLTVAGDRRFEWDWDNRLAAATSGDQTSTYTYDGNGQRATADGAPQLWDPSGDLPKLVGQAGTAYLHAPTGGLQSSIAPGGTTTWAQTDALGSTRSLTDSTGAVVGQASYSAFGQSRSASGATSTFGFTGEQTDPTGLVYLRARQYDPARGQLLSPDTVLPNAPGTQGWNRYAYVANNPTTWLDPSGNTAIVEYGQTQASKAQTTVAASRLGKCLSGAITEGAEGLAIAALTGGATASSVVIDAATGCLTGGLPGPAPGATDDVVQGATDATRAAPRATPASSRTIVIGEDMEGRVIPYAKRIGADYYDPPPAPRSQWMDNNRRWINDRMDEGCTIISCGAAPGRPNYPNPSSPYYQMELDEIAKRGYPTSRVDPGP